MPDPRHLIIYALLAICAGLGLYTLKLKGDLRLSEMSRKNEALVFERERLRAAEVLIKRQGEYRQVETNLTAALTIEREQSNEVSKRFARQRDDLLGQLRDAKARADAANLPRTTATAGPGQAAAGDDGALVPRPVGERDVREAERADNLRVALLGCYRAYDRARTEIESLTPE